MVENDVVEFIESSGKKVFIHCVINGGQAMKDTVTGLMDILDDHQAEVVVWQNEFFGPVEMDGVKFIDTPLFLKNTGKIKGVIILFRLNQDTSMKDMHIMISNKMTFNEAMCSDKFSMMPRQRLKKIQKSVNDQLQSIGL